ncbi:MAG: xanthine dehydrogenase family protein molybdopterin-binding subunit [Nitrososphaerota archaeon]|nr:xanthine dehydrogenase family protein molybdopterin-binding subunit [Nitrososphaerota archaeon]
MGNEKTRTRYIGRSIPQNDSPLKVTGTATYASDIELPGMLFAKLVTSDRAHAKILSIDTKEAKSVPGVVAIATGSDFPFRIGIYVGDRDLLATDKVRWVGHPVAAVIAETLQAAEEAAEKVQVQYEDLPAVFNVRDALKPGAPIIHEHMSEYRVFPAFSPVPGTNIANKFVLKRGDAKAALDKAHLVIEEEFRMPRVSHAFMETQTVVALYRRDGVVEVWSSLQSPFAARYLMAQSLNMPVNNVIIHHPFCGGGFGGKAGLGWEPLVALLSKMADNKPVKLILSRKEQFVSAAVREAFIAHVKAGFEKDGKFVAYQADFIMDCGGYGDYTVNVSRTTGYAADGSYDIENLDVTCRAVYTNQVPTTAMRGFGYPEGHWPLEQLLDRAAARLHLDPVKIRLVNLVKPGESTTGTGEHLREDAGDPRRVLSTIVKELKPNGRIPESKEPWVIRARGFALNVKGPSQPPNASGSSILKFNEDGSIDLLVGTGLFGQGTTTALCMIVAEEFGLPLEKVRVPFERGTDSTAYTWQTVGSRGLFVDGNATLGAIREAKAKIVEISSQVFRVPKEDVVVRDGAASVRGRPWLKIPLSDIAMAYTYPNGNAIGGPLIGTGTWTSVLNSYLNPETGQGIPSIFHTFGGTGVEITLNLLTGEICVEKGVQVEDIGRVINRLGVEQQMDGGMIMGMSISLWEKMQVDGQGWVTNPNFSNYYIARMKDMPGEIRKVAIETPQEDGPWGARGVGEMTMISVAPAIANAVFRATGVILRDEPMTPETVWLAIREQRPDLLEKAMKALGGTSDTTHLQRPLVRVKSGQNETS